MGDSGIFRTGNQVWQRAHIMAAANYLREQISQSPGDRRARSVYEGLLEVLEPSRRAVRVQREQLALTQASVPVKTERRARDRRTRTERRVANQGAPHGLERRSSIDRRRSEDRRRRG
jgi:hypothetical protein